MILGVTAALVWQAWPRIGWLPGLPANVAGIHGFVVGTSVGFLVILAGTLLGKPAPREAVKQAFKEN